MAFHPNQHTQGNIFPNRSQGIDHNQDIGQSLSPINSFTGSLGSFSSRQFDPTGYDNRTYLNSADPWKSNSSLLQQEQNATSPSLRNSLPSGGHGDLSSIQNISAPTSGFSNQTIRMMQNNNTQVPYFNQTSLVSASQSPYSDYQNISTSNGQSQAMSVAHMAPQSPTASFIRRYSGNTNMINGIDPSSLTNGMGYSNPGYTGQVGGLDNFGRNNLNQYVENDNVISNSILKSKSEAMTGLQYASSSNLGSGSTHSNLMNNDSNAMSHENHFQSGGNIESNYSTGFSQDAEYQRSPHSLPLTRPSNISRSQFPSETVAPNQVSTTPIKIPKARPLIIKDSSTVSPNALTKSKHEDHDLSIKPKSAHSPKSKAFSSKPNSSLSLNATPTGQKLKRPMNAFLIYASERRPQLQQSDPTMTTAAQSKILGDEWAKMDDSLKQLYVERARVLKSQFLETNPEYVYTRRPNNTKKKYRRRSTIDGDSGSPKLKRPMNAYLLFNKEMRHKLLETNPNMSVSEISKEIGDRWKNLDEEARSRYFTEAQSIKRDFLVTNPDFVYTRRSKAEIEAGKRRGIDEEDDLTPTKDPRGRKKKKQKNPTAPKHPMSGFLFYLSAVRPQVAEQYPGSTVGPISKIIANQWNSMSPEERVPWEQKASEDKARYAREMEGYLADRQ